MCWTEIFPFFHSFLFLMYESFLSTKSGNLIGCEDCYFGASMAQAPGAIFPPSMSFFFIYLLSFDSHAIPELSAVAGYQVPTRPRKVYLFSNCPFFSLHLVHNREDTCRNNLSISRQNLCFLGNSKFFPFRYYNHSSVLNDTGPLST